MKVESERSNEWNKTMVIDYKSTTDILSFLRNDTMSASLNYNDSIHTKWGRNLSEINHRRVADGDNNPSLLSSNRDDADAAGIWL